MTAEIKRLLVAIEAATKYLARMVAKGDEAGILKWSTRLADFSTRLAAVVAPPLTEEERVALEPAPEPPPNFGESQKMSSELYGEFAIKWMQRTFPHLYADWPPTVHATSPQSIADAAKRDGCLAQVTAAGVFGGPDSFNAGLGDYSLYTALTSEGTGDGFVHKVWHMGELVGEKVGGPDDGLDYAHSLGFNW